MKLVLKKILLLSFVFSFVFFSKAEKLYNDFGNQKLPFEMDRISIPSFPDNEISITECGGVGDGVTLNTVAFEKAIQKLSQKGGGTLKVPFGIWFTGPIVFRSNIQLYLEKGAVILFTTDFDAYPLLKTSYEGVETRRCQSPISGRNLENVAITGEGIINGSGEAWRPLKKSKVTESYWKKVINSGGVLKDSDYWFPSQKSLKGELLSEKQLLDGNLTEEEWNSIKDFLRPVMVSFIECKNVYLQGVLFENSPSWAIHPLLCENLTVENIFVRNPLFAQNGDGIDVESCKNVIITRSTFDVGDDAICLKSGKDESGRKRGRPTENVVVENCTVFKGHGGFVVGSEMSGGIRNVSVSNCKFMGTDVGLRFKSNRGRGGVVENIFISNISMNDIVTDAFLFDLYYGGKSASESLEDGDEEVQNTDIKPVDETTPVFRNIFVENIISRNSRRAMFFNGLPEMNISNIHIENAQFSSEFGAELVESDGIVFKNVSIYPLKGEKLILKNVKKFKTIGCNFSTDSM